MTSYNAKIHWADLIKNALKNASNPVSVDGSAALFKVFIAGGGPYFHSMVEKMPDHPVGKRLLRDKPELGERMDDLKTLCALPEGTLGRMLGDFFSIREVYPASLLATQGHRHNYINKICKDWNPDALWLAERLFYTHDLMHAVAGYGGSLMGEVLVAPAEIASFDRRAKWPARVIAEAAALLPSAVGRKQMRAALLESWRRGVAMAEHIPFYCIYWEELFDQPLSAVTKHTGLPMGNIAAGQETWLKGGVYDAIAKGFGTIPRDEIWLYKMKDLIQEHGASPKDLWRMGESKRKGLYALLDSGAPKSKIKIAIAAAAN